MCIFLIQKSIDMFVIFPWKHVLLALINPSPADPG